MQNMSKRNRILFFVFTALIVISLIVAAILGINKATSQNQFGKFIKIQNYDAKVKKVSSDVKDAIQSSLYNTVKTNTADDFNPATVKDAFIRDDSETQSFDTTTKVYNGSFLVDMASIKQTYQVQYSYSTSNTIDTGGSPIIITCPNTDQLKYGAFPCTDLSSAQSNPEDILLQYLPYENFSFKLSPDATSGKLVINATLDIADSDYGTTPAEHAQAVADYKGYIVEWLNTKTIDSSKYTFKYNYTAAGDYLGDGIFQ